MTRRYIIFTSLFLIFNVFITKAYSSAMLDRIALLDTGYDACLADGGMKCEENKNLLFRGDQPLPDDPPFYFDFNYFRENIFSYIQQFKQAYDTEARLPIVFDDLKNYRIVVINLLYDFYANGSQSELNELQYEFKHSGIVDTLQIPEQHKMYGLKKPFYSDQYAFEWWPVTLANHINWPDKQGTPPHTFKPDVYKVLNLTFLITGKNFYGDRENDDALSLRTLLTSTPDDGHPLLIFYHCVAGKDRTGAVSQSYLMQYGGYPYLAHMPDHKISRKGPLSYTDSLKASSIPDHLPTEESKQLARAYCLSLNKKQADCDLRSA